MKPTGPRTERDHRLDQEGVIVASTPPPTIRQGSLGDRVAHELRARIVRREIPAGTHLVEDTLAAEYDVNRGPIRDALKSLDTEGLVRSQRRGVLRALSHD